MSLKVKYITSLFEIKSVEESGIFEGYGSVFNLVDHSKDVVVKGAFEKSLESWKQKGQMPPILWQHDSRNPIGVYEKVYEDSVGLFVRGQLLIDDVQQAKEAYALMKAGALSGLSIGYIPVVDEYDRETGITTLKELDLWEVSPVTFPDNDLARVSDVKSASEITTKRDFESFLRESGFSKSEAIRIASKGFERRESADPTEDAELKSILKQSISILQE